MTQPAPPALARPPQPRQEARAPTAAAATATPQALVPGRPLRTNAARLLLALLAERHLKPCAWVAMHRPPPLCYAYAATLCRAGRDRVAKVSPGRWRHAPPMSVCTRQVARAHVFGRRGAPLRHTWGCARVRRACVFNWAVVVRWCVRGGGAQAEHVSNSNSIGLLCVVVAVAAGNVAAGGYSLNRTTSQVGGHAATITAAPCPIACPFPCLLPLFATHGGSGTAQKKNTTPFALLTGGQP